MNTEYREIISQVDIVCHQVSPIMQDLGYTFMSHQSKESPPKNHRLLPKLSIIFHSLIRLIVRPYY